MDLRKYADLKKTKELNKWNKQVTKHIKQKINLKKLKLRIKNRLIKKTLIRNTEFDYKCPVYMCKCSEKTEDALLQHYNSVHSDLVNLGLKVLKSKESRDRDKGKICLNLEAEKASKQSDSSFSEMNDDQMKDNYSNSDREGSDLNDLI